MTRAAHAFTEGARLVAVLAAKMGPTSLALRLGTSEGTVRHLATGRRLPSEPLRARLVALGVPLEAWAAPPAGPPPVSRRGHLHVVEPAAAEGPRVDDGRPRKTHDPDHEFRPGNGEPQAAAAASIEVLAPSVAAPPEPATSSAPAEAEDAPLVDRYRRLAAVTERKLLAAEADPHTSPRDVAALAAAHARALWSLAKLTGATDLTMPMIVRSSAWRDFAARLGEVLERHPEAAAELADVLEALEAP